MLLLYSRLGHNMFYTSLVKSDVTRSLRSLVTSDFTRRGIKHVMPLSLV